ncbi:MAG: hypothetical protein LBS36_04645 [Oscillospiraceae bacterium]|nr:hypothetical protein [Oscillospiraceae bacterium]
MIDKSKTESSYKKIISRFIKTFFSFMVVFLLFFAFESNAYASASSPTLILIVSNAPSDISVSLSEEAAGPSIRTAAWKKYITVYPKDFDCYDADLTLNLSGGSQSLEVVIKKGTLSGPADFVSLDFKNQTILPGRTPGQYAASIIIATSLTFLLEGILFYRFGFRKKSSWVIFLLSSAFLYGIVNAWLYLCFPLIFVMIGARFISEFFIIPFRICVFYFIFRKERKHHFWGYVLKTDVLNLILGILLIIFLPI